MYWMVWAKSDHITKNLNETWIIYFLNHDRWTQNDESVRVSFNNRINTFQFIVVYKKNVSKIIEFSLNRTYLKDLFCKHIHKITWYAHLSDINWRRKLPIRTFNKSIFHTAQIRHKKRRSNIDTQKIKASTTIASDRKGGGRCRFSSGPLIETNRLSFSRVKMRDGRPRLWSGSIVGSQRTSPTKLTD